MNRMQVLIADDYEDARWLALRLLSKEFAIASAVADGKQLIDAALALRPDVIVSDVSMPLITGTQAMQRLKTKGMDIPFVLMSLNSINAEDYIQAGALAFVDKLDIGYELVPAVRAASIGQIYFSRSVRSLTTARVGAAPHWHA